MSSGPGHSLRSARYGQTTSGSSTRPRTRSRSPRSCTATSTGFGRPTFRSQTLLDGCLGIQSCATGTLPLSEPHVRHSDGTVVPREDTCNKYFIHVFPVNSKKRCAWAKSTTVNLPPGSFKVGVAASLAVARRGLSAGWVKRRHSGSATYFPSRLGWVESLAMHGSDTGAHVYDPPPRAPSRASGGAAAALQWLRAALGSGFKSFWERVFRVLARWVVGRRGLART